MNHIDKAAYLHNVVLALGADNQRRQEGEAFINQLQQHGQFITFIMEVTYEMQDDQVGLFSSVILKNYLVQNYSAIAQDSRVSIQSNLMTLYL